MSTRRIIQRYRHQGASVEVLECGHIGKVIAIQPGAPIPDLPKMRTCLDCINKNKRLAGSKA